jgi:hypothetical protein
VESDEEGHWITTGEDDLGTVSAALEGSLGESETAKFVWRPKVTTPATGEAFEKLMRSSRCSRTTTTSRRHDQRGDLGRGHGGLRRFVTRRPWRDGRGRPAARRGHPVDGGGGPPVRGMTAIVKHVGSDVPAAQSAFLRFALGLPFAVPMLWPLWRDRLTPGQLRLFGARGVVHALGVLCWFFAMTRIPWPRSRR